ncbi:MAG: NYN domain-containing protein [Planctomycetales bacterium]|nr:NYN domain-containing protein [Planctomycetales bacterium]
MAIIIDGYNLMNVTRFAVGRRDKRRFDEARNEMLRFLSEHLSAVGETDVAVVFDSDVKKRLPSQQELFGLRVYFARDYPTADDLIEELIAECKQPSNLIVVSSDHRIQVFAQRKRAMPIDSDVWFDCLLEAVHDANQSRVQPQQTDDVDNDEPLFENPFPDGYGEDLG